MQRSPTCPRRRGQELETKPLHGSGFLEEFLDYAMQASSSPTTPMAHLCSHSRFCNSYIADNSSRGHHNKTTTILYPGPRALTLERQREHMKGTKCKKMCSGSPRRPSSQQVTVKMDGSHCTALTVLVCLWDARRALKEVKFANGEDS